MLSAYLVQANQHSSQGDSADNYEKKDLQNLTFTQNGVDLFLIGKQIPSKADGYLIEKGVETRYTEEGEEEIPIYSVYKNGQKYLTNDR